MNYTAHAGKPKSQENQFRIGRQRDMHTKFVRNYSKEDNKSGELVYQNVFSQGGTRDHIKVSTGGHNYQTAYQSFQKQSSVEEDQKIDSQRLAQIMSQDFKRNQLMASGEGVVQHYQPKHLDLLDFNDYNSNQIQPYAANKQFDATAIIKLPSTTGTNMQKFAKRPGPASKKMMNTQIIRSHNGRIKDITENEFSQVRRNLEQSKSQLDCHNNTLNSQQILSVSKNLCPYTISNQKQAIGNSKQINQQQFKQLYNIDVSGGNPNANKLRLSDNSNFIGSFFNGNLINSIVIDRDIVHHSGLKSELPKIIHNSSNSQTNPETVSAAKASVQNKKTEALVKMNADLTQNLQLLDATKSQVSPNASLFSLNNPQYNSVTPAGSKKIPTNSSAVSKTRFQSNKFSRPKMQPNMGKHDNSIFFQQNHNQSKISFHEVGDPKSTIERMDNSFDLEAINMMSNKRDKLWFPGVPFDSIVSTQVKKQTCTIDRNQTQLVKEELKNLTLSQSELARSKPWNPQNKEQFSVQRSTIRDNHESEPSRSVSKPTTQKSEFRKNNLKRTQLAPITQSNSNSTKNQPTERGRGENKSNPIIAKSKVFHNEPIFEQTTNRNGTATRNQTENHQPKKASVQLGRIRPSRNHQTEINTNESSKLSRKNKSTKSKGSRGTPTPNKHDNLGAYKNKDPLGFLNAKVPVNIKIKAGHRNTAQNFNTETFGKRADSTPKDEERKSQMKDLFEKSVHKEQAAIKQSQRGRQTSKKSSPKKSIIRNGELLQVDPNDVRKSHQRVSTQSPRNPKPNVSPKQQTAPPVQKSKQVVSPKGGESAPVLPQSKPPISGNSSKERQDGSVERLKPNPSPKATSLPKQTAVQKPSPRRQVADPQKQSEAVLPLELKPHQKAAPQKQKADKQVQEKPKPTIAESNEPLKQPKQNEPKLKQAESKRKLAEPKPKPAESKIKQDEPKPKQTEPKLAKVTKQSKGSKSKNEKEKAINKQSEERPSNPTPEPFVDHPSSLQPDLVNILVQDSQLTPKNKGKKPSNKKPESILKKTNLSTPEQQFRGMKKDDSKMQPSANPEIRYIMPPDSSLELIEITNQDPSIFQHMEMNSSNHDLKRSVMMETPMQGEDEVETYERLHSKSDAVPFQNRRESKSKSRVSIVSKEEEQIQSHHDRPSKQASGSRNQSSDIQAKRKATSGRSEQKSDSAKRSNRQTTVKSGKQSVDSQSRKSPHANKPMTPKESSLPESSQIASIYGQSIKPDDKSKRNQNIAKSFNQPSISKLQSSANQVSKNSKPEKSLSKNSNGHPSTRQSIAKKKQSVMTRKDSIKIHDSQQYRTQQQFQDMGVGSDNVMINTHSSKRSIKAPRQFKDMACGNSDDKAATDNVKSMKSKSKKSQKSQKSRSHVSQKSNKVSIRRCSKDSLSVAEHRENEVTLEESMTRSDGQGLRRRMKHQETDWMHSEIYHLVQQLLRLDSKNRMVESKLLLEQFLNPKNADIFTEEEAGYFSSLLRRKALTEIVIDENQRPLLEEMHEKAKLSVMILSDHLNLTIDDFNATDAHNQSIHSIDQSIILTRSPRQPIIFRNHKYEEVNIESLIKLLLRIRQLYGAIQELIKILSTIHKLRDLTGDQGAPGFIAETVAKYSQVENRKQKLESDEEQMLIKTLNRFQTLSRRISRFLLEHKLFRHFVFGNQKYQKTLLGHATEICELFQRRGSKEAKSKYGEAFLSDFLEFNEVQIEESEVQNLQDADECNRDEFEMQIDNMFDRSQKSGVDAYKSDIDLRNRHFHFGILSMRSDSQENILTMTNKGSHLIQHHDASEPETNKSMMMLNKKHFNGHSFNAKTVQSPLSKEEAPEILSSNSNATLIVGKQEYLRQSNHEAPLKSMQTMSKQVRNIIQQTAKDQVVIRDQEDSDHTVQSPPVRL